MDYDSLEDKITDILKQHIPIKKRYIRANDGAFMNKELRKAIMHRYKLSNICNKTKTEENLIAYKKQRGKCVKLLRKRKRDYFRNLDPKDITDNRKFWKSVKPIFSDKVQTYQSIALIENRNL